MSNWIHCDHCGVEMVSEQSSYLTVQRVDGMQTFSEHWNFPKDFCSTKCIIEYFQRWRDRYVPKEKTL